MPNNVEFNTVKNVKTIEVCPKNWTCPLCVEYGVVYDYMPIINWRVVGTYHTFTIPLQRLDFISSGNYKAHFEDALQSFREDYLEWYNDEFKLDWQQEYKEQFERFILISKK